MVIGKRIYSLIIFPLIVLKLSAIEYMPWIGNYLEFEWRNSVLFQHYSSVAKRSRYVHRSGDDTFYRSSLSNSVGPNFSLEAEVVAAQTKKQRPGFDHLSLAGRYVLLDDVAGDPMTLTTGAVFTHAAPNAVRDIGSFHHAVSEAEVFLSAGKETGRSGENWTARWWAVAGAGSAIRYGGAFWLRGKLAYDCRPKENHEAGVFTRCLFGLGSKRLHLQDFHGYGPVQHQSLDFGLSYTYTIRYFGEFSVEYSYRPYARNFPAQTQQILCKLLYTFGL